jgi:hypothetical protein
MSVATKAQMAPYSTLATETAAAVRMRADELRALGLDGPASNFRIAADYLDDAVSRLNQAAQSAPAG